jgi:VanZ family protein
LKTTFLKFIPGIIWFFITFWLFTLPGSNVPKFDLFQQLQGDKLVHAFLFFVLCILFMLPLIKWRFSLKIRGMIILIISFVFIGYGIAIEFIQRDFIENRSFDFWDIVADIIGCLLALWYCKSKLLV